MPRKPKKVRIPLSADVNAEVLFRSQHTCCKCREPGKPVQIHHIDEDPANNDVANLAVLCLICHNETMVSGGFGKQLKETEVIRYRDDWIARVEHRRNTADDLAIQAMTISQSISPDWEPPPDLKFRGPDDLVEYVDRLPVILAAAYLATKPLMARTTLDMVTGAYEVIEVVVKMLIKLSDWWPENHFNEQSAEIYFNNYLSERATWCRALAYSQGYDRSGTIARINAAFHLRSEMEDAVATMVHSYFSDMTGEYIPAFDNWKARWKAASN